MGCTLGQPMNGLPHLRTGSALLLAWAFTMPAPGASQTAEPDPTLAQARTYFAEMRAIGERDAGRFWGRRIDGPLLLADPGTRRVLANRADPEGHLVEQDGVYVGQLPEDVGIANTGVDWAGVRWTMVLWPLPSLRIPRARLLAHESFHRLQPALGWQAGNPQNAHLEGESGRLWLRLEMRALADALLTHDERERDARIGDALLFRDLRRADRPATGEEEDALERNEGLAEYTGLHMSGVPAWALPDRAAVALERADARTSLTRSFAYATGPAWALLLDRLDPRWRDTFDGSGSLSERVRAALPDPPTGADVDAARKRARRYGGDRLAEEEASRARRRVERESALRAVLVDGPTLELPVGEEFGYTFDPNGVVPLPGVGQVFAGARVRDTWGVLEVDGNVLMVRGADGPIRSVVVAAPASGAEEGVVVGPDWRLTLARGWRVVRVDGGGSRVARRP